MNKKKIGIITGGAGFLGKQYCESLSKNNYKIILIDINYKQLSDFQKKLKKINIHIDVMKGDIRDENKIKDINKKIIKKYKKIDLLINNAAINHSPKQSLKINDFLNFKINLLKKEIDVGLIGAFVCSKIFAKQMIKQNDGIIINISSDLSVIAPDQRLYSHLNFVKPISYSIIKHGILGLTKYLSVYLAKHNIRVNSFSPGGMYNNQDKIFIKKIKKIIPLQRMANKNEYNGIINFLSSEDSSYITGHNLVADGGRSII
jgi:NAD(P)-dependent dehydrogenase (short-subunit alcohol dehydrogenase family)